MIRLSALTLALGIAVTPAFAESAMMHNDPLLTYVQAERLEYRGSPGEALWDFQGWLGRDYDKLWVKTEGHADGGDVGEAELQLLYSRAWSAFFDLQFGMRLTDADGQATAYGVAGVQGLAPYRIELDAALFVSEDGDVSLRSEFERDIYLGERLVLQPRLELDLSLADVPELGVGSGLSSASAGLRLRYEITRKLAPYAGVEHGRYFGNTADFVRAAGGDTDETSLLAGIRFWF